MSTPAEMLDAIIYNLHNGNSSNLIEDLETVIDKIYETDVQPARGPIEQLPAKEIEYVWIVRTKPEGGILLVTTDEDLAEDTYEKEPAHRTILKFYIDRMSRLVDKEV